MILFKELFQSIFKKNKFEELKLENESLRGRLSALIDDLHEKDSKISDLSIRISSLTEQIDRLNRQNRQIDTLKRQISTLKSDIVSKSNDSRRNEQLVRSLNSEIDLLNKRVSQEETDSIELRENLKTARKELGTSKRKLTLLQRKYDSKTTEFDTFKQDKLIEIESLQSSNKDISNRLSILNSENIRLKEQLQIQRENHLKELDVLKEEANTLQAKEQELLSLQVKIEECIQVLESKNSEIEVLEGQINLLKSEMASFKNVQSNVDSKLLEALKQDAKSKQEEITQLEFQIQKLNEELSENNRDNDLLKSRLEEKNNECRNLKESLKGLSDKNSRLIESARQLDLAQQEIKELNRRIQSLPKEDELLHRDSIISQLENEIAKLRLQLNQPNNTNEPHIPTTPVTPPKPTPKSGHNKPIFPYSQRPSTSNKSILKQKDFPRIENDNIYASSNRLIDEVYDCRTNTLISASTIFLKWTADEISKLRFDLEEASRRNEPYLVCPCCHQKVKISSRTIGFGHNSREIQYFTHAVKNIPCDLKRNYTYCISIDGIEYGVKEQNDGFKVLRDEIEQALTSEVSVIKGISDVKISNLISSDEMSLMKRRLADVSASYNGRNLIFELVTPTTNSSKLHDRDIFYLINKFQVFWILGVNSKVDYNELRRSVAKDILFTNKRNVFVFDIEAQEESRRRGELIIKCNWLDEDNEWYYQIERNGKNGLLISLDQIKFDDDSCRPYYFDADEPYFLKHPKAKRPAKLSREELKKDLQDIWSYNLERDKAIKEMIQTGNSVEAFFDGEKWGFKYNSIVFVEPQFSEEPYIYGSFARIQQNGKYGIVNRFGDITLKTIYNRVEILPNDIILYSDGKEWRIFGIIEKLASCSKNDIVDIKPISKKDKTFHLLIKKSQTKDVPEEFYFFYNQIFKKDKSLGKWTLWYSNGKTTTDIIWDKIEVATENSLRLIVGNRVEYLFQDGTLNGEKSPDVVGYHVQNTLSNGYCIIKHYDGPWGIIDSDHNPVETPKCDFISLINDRFLRYEIKNKWGVMSINGTVLIDAKYRSIESYSDNCFNVTIIDSNNPGKYLSGKIDQNGTYISETFAMLNNGLSITRQFGRFGLESDDRVVIKHAYDKLYHWHENKYIALKSGYFGIIDTEEDILLPFEYSKITPLVDNRSTVIIGKKTISINSECQVIEDEIITLRDGYKKFKIAGKWGMLAPDGSEIVAPKYDEITTFRGRLIGIINGRLVKLAAYYPYRLQMAGINKHVNGKDMVQVSSLLFQINPQRVSASENSSAVIALSNWCYNMKYPQAIIFRPNCQLNKVKQIDKLEDFSIGEKFEVKVEKIYMKTTRTKLTKFKYATVMTHTGKQSYIYLSDIMTSGLDPKLVIVGATFQLTKLGYNEELDRTIWYITNA